MLYWMAGGRVVLRLTPMLELSLKYFIMDLLGVIKLTSGSFSAVPLRLLLS